MEFFFLGAGAGLLILAFRAITVLAAKHSERTLNSKNPEHSNSVCPVCSTRLFKGQNIYSKVYRPMTVPDQRCTISGCPNCYPVCLNGVKRICPVCKKELSKDDWLVTRLFNKTSGKKHVMVIGCTRCMKGVK